ncbi:hypothetical protein NXS19_013507 [Fusarium pseudograminearum]|nr:hypothetical protein NXS19_013507 [Fusarium pseudograminearum]
MQRNQRNTQDEFDEEFDIPLHRKRPFGAGIKRKQIEFVRARDPDAGLSTATTSTATLVGDLGQRGCANMSRLRTRCFIYNTAT